MKVPLLFFAGRWGREEVLKDSILFLQTWNPRIGNRKEFVGCLFLFRNFVNIFPTTTICPSSTSGVPASQSASQDSRPRKGQTCAQFRHLPPPRNSFPHKVASPAFHGEAAEEVFHGKRNESMSCTTSHIIIIRTWIHCGARRTPVERFGVSVWSK